MFFDFITIEFFGDNNIFIRIKINYNNNNISIKNIKKLKSISNDLIKSILYQLVSNYNNNNTNINYILLNKLTNIQKKIF